jgi:hypothetical protein
LEQKVQAIEQFSQPHPVSVKAAVAACKRYLAEPETSRIRLADLITDECRRVCKELIATRFANTSEDVTTASVTSRVRQYDGLCETLSAIAFEIGRWGTTKAVASLTAAQRRLYSTKASQGLVLWISYQGYPVTLLTYSALLGASFDGRFDVVASLLTNELEVASRSPVLAVDVAPAFCLLSEDPQAWGRLLEGKDRRYAPLNEWLADLLWGRFGGEFDSRADFDLRFDWVEVVLAMANHKLCPPVFNAEWHPPGCYGYRTANRERVIQKIKGSVESNGGQSPYVVSGLFGGTALEVQQTIEAFEAWATKLRGHWR